MKPSSKLTKPLSQKAEAAPYTLASQLGERLELGHPFLTPKCHQSPDLPIFTSPLSLHTTVFPHPHCSSSSLRNRCHS